jgi:hypothetical protein
MNKIRILKIGKCFFTFYDQRGEKPFSIDRTRIILCGSLFHKLGCIYYILRTKYAGPKDYAEKVVIKIAKSKTKTAETFLFMHGYRHPNGMYSPAELNKILKKDLGVLLPDSSVRETYLRPSVITKILKNLERLEIYYNVKGKRELRKQKGTESRKSPSGFKRLGGRPSAYVISDIYAKSDELMRKPEIRGLIRKKLIESNIGPLVWKYLFMTFLYSIKIDKEAALKIFPVAGPPPASINPSDLNSQFDEIASLDESKFEEVAEIYAKFMLDSDLYFSVSGLLGLLLHR